MTTAADTPLAAVIIGSGFSGLCMGIKLREAGVEDFVILEKAADVGGVWRENTYPGACCDIPANLYSFSFDMKTDWTRRYPPQPEIQAYIRDCVERYGLMPKLRFNTEVASASFDDASGLWTVTACGARFTARSLMTGVGQLSRPAMPKIPGAEQFKGPRFHSAQWDHAVDLRGKRVAVIGTGASAIQFIPPVAGQAGQLHVIQRTPPYVMPKMDREYTAWHRFMFRHVPGYQRLYRAFWYRLGEVSCGAFHNGSWLASLFRFITLAYMRRHVKDPVLREKLTPDYPIGCKRVLFGSNYFETLARTNVSLETDAIREITENAVVLQSGKSLSVDVIIYGTGFAATEFLAPMRITGSGGRELGEAWRDGAEAYLGVTVAGFPNFFMLYGPNTNLGSNSIIFMIECQVRYILSCLAAMRQRGAQRLEVREDVQRRYNEQIQADLKASVWSAGCHSWYHNAAGKVTNNWPGYTQTYRRLTQSIQATDYSFT